MQHLDKDVQRLQYAFKMASKHLGKAVKGTEAYDHQVDFMYMLNDIVQGHEATARKAIANANNLINTILESKPK